MERTDIVTILCALNRSHRDFEDILTAFIYEYENTIYEIEFQKMGGKFKKFIVNPRPNTKT